VPSILSALGYRRRAAFPSSTLIRIEDLHDQGSVTPQDPDLVPTGNFEIVAIRR
jgi:hypothetical protein